MPNPEKPAPEASERPEGQATTPKPPPEPLIIKVPPAHEVRRNTEKFKAPPEKEKPKKGGPVEGTPPVEEEGPWLSPGEVKEVRVDFVEGYVPVRKTILNSGSVIAMEGPEAEQRMEEVLEAMGSGKTIKEAPKGMKKYRPEGHSTLFIPHF